MSDVVRKSFEMKVSGLELRIEALGEFVPKERLKIDQEFFEKMCKEGCPNYRKHYGCPPGSPGFDEYTEGAKHFLVLMFCAQPKGKSPAKFDEIEKAAYPEIDKILRRLEEISGTKHVAARACKLCVPCRKEKNLSCPHPGQRRNCTVSLGIDCQDIADNIFHKPLVWQKGEKLEKYTSFICLVPMRDLGNKDKIINELKNSSGVL